MTETIATPVDPYAFADEIECALNGYCRAHPEWRSETGAEVIDELFGVIQRFWYATAKGGPFERRHLPPPSREYGPDGIPF